MNDLLEEITGLCGGNQDTADEIIAKVEAKTIERVLEAVIQNKSTDNERMWKEKYDYRRGYLQAINDSMAAIKGVGDE